MAKETMSIVKANDIQLEKIEHPTNLFRGRVFAKLYMKRSNAYRNVLVRIDSCNKVLFKFDLPQITVVRTRWQ